MGTRTPSLAKTRGLKQQTGYSGFTNENNVTYKDLTFIFIVLGCHVIEQQDSSVSHMSFTIFIKAHTLHGLYESRQGGCHTLVALPFN
jgi:hypothetical protein